MCYRCAHGSVQRRVSRHLSTVVDIRHVVFSCFCVVKRRTDSQCAFSKVHALDEARVRYKINACLRELSSLLACFRTPYEAANHTQHLPQTADLTTPMFAER